MKRVLVLVLILMTVPAMALSQGKKEKVVAPPQTVIKSATSGAHSAVLNWTAPTTCVDGSACTPTGYKVYKAAVACPASGLPTGATVLTTVTTTTYTDSTLTAPGAYCYYVTATNSGGESAASNTSGGSLAQPVIAAPTNFTVTLQP